MNRVKEHFSHQPKEMTCQELVRKYIPLSRIEDWLDGGMKASGLALTVGVTVGNQGWEQGISPQAVAEFTKLVNACTTTEEIIALIYTP